MALSYLAELEKRPLIISLMNQKGGCGKTTIATNLVYGLNKRGIKTLLVDADPQGSARDWHILNGGKLVPCIGLDIETLSVDLEHQSRGYHVIIIDCGGELTHMNGDVTKITSAVIKSTDVVLIPVMPSPYDVLATKDLVDLINDRHEIVGRKKPYPSFVISRVIKNTKIGGEIENALKDYSFPILRNKTHNYVLYQTSAAKGESIFCQGESQTASEFNSLIEEIIATFISRSSTYA